MAVMKTTTKQIDAYNSMLDKFAKGVWPEDEEDLLYFLIKWQTWIASRVARIETMADLKSELKSADCVL